MDLLADEIEEFVTGERQRLEPDRVLATVPARRPDRRSALA